MSRNDALTISRIAMSIGENGNFQFFSAVARQLIWIETTAVGTACTDGRVCYFNPEFVKSLSPDLRKSLVAHEVAHVVYQHPLRVGGRDPELANIAMDYRVNWDLRKAGCVIGDNWLISEKYDDHWSFEQIYADLLKQPKQQGGAGGQGKGKGKGKAGGPAQAQAQPGGQPQPDDGKGPGRPVPAGGPGQVIAPKNITPADLERERQRLTELTHRAVMETRARGKDAGFIEQFLDEVTHPKDDPYETLRRFVSEHTLSDTLDWQRPNRRYMAAGMYLPRRKREGIGQIAFIIDTSGSIRRDEAQEFFAHAKFVMEEYKPEKLWFIQCDAAVQQVIELEHGDEFEPPSVKGRGGTDFRPAFDWVQQNCPEIRCLVFLTDGYGAWPPLAPDFPTLWVCTTDHEFPFGDVVRIRI